MLDDYANTTLIYNTDQMSYIPQPRAYNTLLYVYTTTIPPSTGEYAFDSGTNTSYFHEIDYNGQDQTFLLSKTIFSFRFNLVISGGTTHTFTTNGTLVSNVWQFGTLLTGTALQDGYLYTFTLAGYNQNYLDSSGNSSLDTVTTTPGNGNTSYGRQALNNNTGDYNTAFGCKALRYNTIGSDNTCYGKYAGNALTTGSGNILIGSGVNTDANSRTNCIAIGTGTTTNAANNGIQIGFGTTGSTSCYIDGIDGNNVIGSAVFVSGSGKLGVLLSSERFKENIQDIPKEYFSKMFDLNPVTYTYKTDPQKATNMGLIAERMHEIDPEMVVQKPDSDDGIMKPYTVKYQNLPIILLGMVKELKREIKELKRDNKELKYDLESLRQEIRNMKNKIKVFDW